MKSGLHQPSTQHPPDQQQHPDQRSTRARAARPNAVRQPTERSGLGPVFPGAPLPRQRDAGKREVRELRALEYVDMQLIHSTIEHTPEQFLGTFTKR